MCHGDLQKRMRWKQQVTPTTVLHVRLRKGRVVVVVVGAAPPWRPAMSPLEDGVQGMGRWDMGGGAQCVAPQTAATGTGGCPHAGASAHTRGLLVPAAPSSPGLAFAGLPPARQGMACIGLGSRRWPRDGAVWCPPLRRPRRRPAHCMAWACSHATMPASNSSDVGSVCATRTGGGAHRVGVHARRAASTATGAQHSHAAHCGHAARALHRHAALACGKQGSVLAGAPWGARRGPPAPLVWHAPHLVARAAAE